MSEWLDWFRASAHGDQVTGLAILAIVSVTVFYALRRGVVRQLAKLARQTTVTWDNALHDHLVFERLAHLPPALVITYGVQFIPDLNAVVAALLQRVALSVVVVVSARSLGAFLRAANAIYSSDPEIQRRSIKGYLQVVEIVVYLVSAVLVLSILMDRSPLIFLSGLGAMTAVLLLIFKDTLLGLVASVQIASNDMVRIGDWVELPEFGADGDVIDIALHTVKVQNWDKTITTIPTSKLIEGSFKNWRGMSLSGGRRIKRCIPIDVNTIRFISDEELERFGRFALLRAYIRRKREEIVDSNSREGIDPTINADVRRLTNIGTFRAYVVQYLKHHPKIHDGMTLLVRQLSVTAEGLPIEVYCFSNDTDWGRYEDLQSDIFDHLFAVLPDFDLAVFQNLTDHRSLAARGDAGS